MSTTLTVSRLAESIGISNDELWRVNRGEHMLRDSFNKLPPGSRIKYPHTSEALVNEDNSTDKKVAELSSSAASMVGGGHSAVSGYAVSQVSGVVTQSLQQWLSQLGIAQIRLGLEQDFSLNDSSADILLPVYDAEHMLAFTQLGFRDFVIMIAEIRGILGLAYAILIIM